MDAAQSARSSLPVVLLSSSTQSLLCDVFNDASLFQNALSIEKRVVLWGSQASALEIPHSGVAMPEVELLQRLWQKTQGSGTRGDGEINWVVRSAKTPPESMQHFGSRLANAMSVTLKSKTNRAACWVESLDEGWLFLLPTAEGYGSLLSVGGHVPLLLGQSRLVANQVEGLKEAIGTFPAYPRMLYPLCETTTSGAGSIACGTAAMGFDPICGEGVGNAVREAILASAVVQAIGCDFPAEEVLAHYSARLLAGFFRHLSACRDFYLAGCQSEWWHNELALIQQGLKWTREQIEKQPPPQYRLADFELERCF